MGLFKNSPPAQPSPAADQRAEAASRRAQKRRELKDGIRLAKLDLRDARQSGVPALVAEERDVLAAYERQLRKL